MIVMSNELIHVKCLAHKKYLINVSCCWRFISGVCVYVCVRTIPVKLSLKASQRGKDI